MPSIPTVIHTVESLPCVVNVNFVSLTDLIPDETAPFIAMLDGIEDPFNFGYAIRALYAAGVDGIVVRPRNWTTASSVVARVKCGGKRT